MAEVLHLACGGDENYVEHTAAMVASVLEHRGELDVEVHYLHAPGLSADKRDLFARFVAEQGGTPALIEVGGERIADLPGAFNHVTPAMWYRIFLPELLPGIDRTLYVDADTLAIDDLTPLWRTDLEGAVLGAVQNLWEPWNAGYPAKLGLRTPYFNSGVLLLDLERMRATHAGERVLAYATEHRDELTWPDQDALNIVLGEQTKLLHPRWNAMNSVMTFDTDTAAGVFGDDAVAEARSRPGIRHFEGPSVNKPWHYMCPFPQREEYVRQRARTPWPRVEFEDATLANRVKRLLGRT